MKHNFEDAPDVFPDPHSSSVRCSVCGFAVCILCDSDYAARDDCGQDADGLPLADFQP